MISIKNIKSIFFLLVFFSLTLPSFAQKGYKVIRKAEKKHQYGQNDRALKLLSKAENMNYGFFGNAWLEANRAINLLRAKIYIDKKEYQLARNYLDSISSEFVGDNLDSIRIRTFQLEYGKDSLSSMIDSSLLNTKEECEASYFCYIIIPLTNGKTIRMTSNSFDPNIMIESDERKKIEIWLAWFKGSENYKLIKEKR